MILEIDNDHADLIVQQSLANTYAWLKQDLKIYKKNKNHLHEDDAEVYKKLLPAIETVANWYFAYGDFEKAVKKVKV